MDLTREVPIALAEQDKCQAVLFYSYKLLDIKKKEDFFIWDINTIYELIRKFGKEKQAMDFLNTEIISLMKKKLLTESSQNIFNKQ